MFGWGAILLLPDTLFAGPSWSFFTQLAREEVIGAACVTLGAMRLLVLAVNGAWRPMYHLRSATATLSLTFWFAITIGFAGSGRISTWLAVYPVLFVFDGINALRAAGDAARVDRSVEAMHKAMADGRGA